MPDSFFEDRLNHVTRWRAGMLIAAVLLLLSFSAACSNSEQAPAAQPLAEEPYEGIIVAMGNSLTEGLGVDLEAAFPARLEKMLIENGYRYRVVNAGISGETSSGAQSRVDWVDKLDPDIIMIETGANDAFRGVETGLIEDNITKIIQHYMNRGTIVVLAGMKMVTNLGPQYTADFENLYRNLARRFKPVYIPFFLDGVAGVPKLNQPDGIHPTPEGYAVIVANIYPYILTAIEQHRAKKSSPAD